MRLAIDLACLATARTGAGVYLRELLQRFRSQLPAGTLIEFVPANYPIRRFGPLGKILNNLRLLYWVQWEFPQRAKKAGCQALISPEYLTAYFSALPRIVVVHDAAFGKRPQEYNALWRLLFQKVYLPAIRRAEAVITVTELAKQEIIEIYRVKPERLHIVSDACDSEVFYPRPEADLRQVLTQYGLQPGGYFLHVGVMEKRKNLPCLVRAFAAVAKSHPGMQLVLVGQKGPKADLDDSLTIAQAIQNLGLTGKVLLPGFLPREHLPLLYQGAKAMVFPTLYEGFGIPLLEAMACGTAVACSDLPVLREVAGAAALFFNPESEQAISRALQTMLDDPQQCERLQAAGKLRMTHYSWDASARQFIAVATALATRG